MYKNSMKIEAMARYTHVHFPPNVTCAKLVRRQVTFVTLRSSRQVTIHGISMFKNEETFIQFIQLIYYV